MEAQVTKSGREKDIAWLFDLALIVKLIDGGFEVIVAILALFLSPAFLIRATEFITADELAQDPDDPVAHFLRDAAHSFAIHSHYLFALYLALHGGVKIALVVGIFMKKKIAYPLFMGALVVFGTYEAYRGFVRQDTLLQVFAIIDFTTLILTAYEYRRRYPRQAPPVALGN